VKTNLADLEAVAQPDEPLELVKFLAEHRPLVHRVAVMGNSVFEVVCRAGGWIFDQAALGCHVTVIANETHGAEALSVIGARSVSLEAASGCGEGPRPHVLVVASTLARENRSVRAAVGELIRDEQTKVWLFADDAARQPLSPAAPTVVHELSAATVAFKNHTARALGATRVDTVEVFERVTGRATRLYLAACEAQLDREKRRKMHRKLDA